jgi:hypothetical protein
MSFLEVIGAVAIFKWAFGGEDINELSSQVHDWPKGTSEFYATSDYQYIFSDYHTRPKE